MGTEALAHSRGSHSTVEDAPTELGLFVDRLDGEWRLGLRLPEIPPHELGDTPLGALRQAKVEVHVGTNVVSRISALDLRSGVGAARVPVQPTIQEYATRVAGPWPQGIDTSRWALQSRGVAAKGALFRLRCGEWTRLRNGAGIHQGEELVVLGIARPQAPITAELRTQLAVGGNSYWTYWQVQIPDEPGQRVLDWLGRLGHTILPRPWTVELATPARARDERGGPVFWTDDAPVISVSAPHPRAETEVGFRTGTSTLVESVKTSDEGDAFVAITSKDAGTAQFLVTDRSADLDVVFVARPSREALLGQLATTARVRVWLGETLIEAWRDPLTKVLLRDTPPEVRVDLGSEDARARVTVWKGSKQRTSRGLDHRSAERIITEALFIASRIELDADNFGRIEFMPARAARTSTKNSSRASVRDRMGWFDHAVSVSAPPEQHMATTLIERPRASTSLSVRQVGGLALVRSRLLLRRRHGDVGGNR